MRKQYHARMVDGQKHVWDVHRLVRLSKNLPVQAVLLSDIQGLDGDHWYKDGSALPTPRDIAVHAKLIQECDLGHPIILSADGVVMDGMHRCCRALIEGRTSINSVRFVSDPEPDYIDVDINTLPHDEPVTL